MYNYNSERRLERWPSGRRRSTGNAVWEQSHRGFESLPLRLIRDLELILAER